MPIRNRGLDCHCSARPGAQLEILRPSASWARTTFSKGAFGDWWRSLRCACRRNNRRTRAHFAVFPEISLTSWTGWRMRQSAANSSLHPKFPDKQGKYREFFRFHFFAPRPLGSSLATKNEAAWRGNAHRCWGSGHPSQEGRSCAPKRCRAARGLWFEEICLRQGAFVCSDRTTRGYVQTIHRTPLQAGVRSTRNGRS